MNFKDFVSTLNDIIEGTGEDKENFFEVGENQIIMYNSLNESIVLFFDSNGNLEWWE